MTLPETASFAEFARLAGFKRNYVTELKRAGRLVLEDEGKRVRVAESLALIRSTADPAKAAVVARHAATRTSNGARGQGQGASRATPPAADPDETQPPTEYDGHSTRRSRALADQAELQRRKMEREEKVELGQLLWTADVAQAVRAAGFTLRTTLENLPNTLAPELAAITDEARVRVVLSEAIEHALEELSRQFAAIAKEQTQ